MNMEMMAPQPLKQPEKKEPSPEFFASTGFQSALETCEEEKKKFKLIPFLSEKTKNLKFKGDFETVAKGSMAALLQQFMNIPGPSAKDAASYLYDRLEEKVVLFRKLLGSAPSHAEAEVAY